MDCEIVRLRLSELAVECLSGLDDPVTMTPLTSVLMSHYGPYTDLLIIDGTDSEPFSSWTFRMRKALEQAQKAGEKLAKEVGDVKSKKSAGTHTDPPQNLICKTTKHTGSGRRSEPSLQVDLPPRQTVWDAEWLMSLGFGLGVQTIRRRLRRCVAR